MAFSKADRYPVEQQLLATLGKAIGHPERIKILCLLREEPFSSLQDIARRSPLAYKSVAQHLEALRRSGLVCVTEQPPHVLYTLDEASISTALGRLKVVSRLLSDPPHTR